MKLLTKELRETIPPLYSQEKVKDEDKVVVAKFFTPTSNWTWFVIEGSAVNRETGEQRPLKDYDEATDDVLFFGLVDGFEAEFGYFSLDELKSVKGPFGLGIERDMYFGTKPLADVERLLAAR